MLHTKAGRGYCGGGVLFIISLLVLVLIAVMVWLYFVSKKSRQNNRKRRDAVIDRYYQSVYDEAEEKSGKIKRPRAEEFDKRE